MTTPPPLVTMISLCYNHERYLDDHIAGLLSQTHKNIQLVLLDNGSTDGSWEKIRSFEPKLRAAFPKVVLKRNENIGVFKALAFALGMAEGEFVSMSSTDDYFLPEKIEENVKYLMARPDTGLVHSDFNQVHADRTVGQVWKSQNKKIPEGRVFDSLIAKDFYIVPCLICVRTELMRRYVDFLQYEKEGYLLEDEPMLLDLAAHTNFGYIDKPLACYRIVPGSMSRSKNAVTFMAFRKSVCRIRKDYAVKYHASGPAQKAMEKRNYWVLFATGYECCLRKECQESFAWLAKNYPGEFNTFRYRLRAWSTWHPWIWRLLNGRRPRGEVTA
ncbi:MAG: glycosyltransferase [Candidatus Omnitrophica bacterium]|nr:glycosyltransferase [Candidatus Omnitrophota bacterium]MDD5670480.1 glycosyltransferase [Candidatus Omnitrophota bacterium]